MAITFTQPEIIVKPAYKTEVYSFCITPDRAEVNINYKDVDGNIVKKEIIRLDGSEFNTLMNMKVKNSHLGKKLFKLIKLKIQSRVKIKKNFDGTED